MLCNKIEVSFFNRLNTFESHYNKMEHVNSEYDDEC